VTEFADSYSRSYRIGALVGGDYHLLKELGRGGMGAVFLAQHRLIDKPVALKILFPDLVNASTWKRFESEARILARLQHPGIVSILNMGVDAGRCPFYVMELLEGLSLSQLIKERGQLSLRQAVQVFVQIAEAMHFAHEKGVIHRDLKPSNIMLINWTEKETAKGHDQERRRDASGTSVKIVDFGIAKSIDTKGQLGLGLLSPDENQKLQSLTQTGEIFGTPFYLSPEQSLGRPVSRQTDIYALGCTFFEALTGEPPFRGANAFETMGMHLAAPVPALSQYVYGLPSEVQAIVNLCLNKDTEGRYSTMKQLALDLARVNIGLPTAAAGLKSEGFAPSLQINTAVSAEEQELSEKQTKKKAKSFLSLAVLAGVATLALLFGAGLHYAKLEKTKVDMSKDKSLKPATEVLEVVSSNADRFERKLAQGIVEGKGAEKLLAPLADFGPVKQGDRYLFSFPTNFSLGYMQDKFCLSQSQPVKAQGQVFVKLPLPALDLDEDLPLQVVGKLKPDSVDLKVTIYHDEQLESLKKSLRNWKHLWSLQIKDRKLDPAFIEELLDLPFIENLHVHNTVAFGGQKTIGRLIARTVIIEQVSQAKPGALESFLSILQPRELKELLFRRTPIDSAIAKKVVEFKDIETLSFEGMAVQPAWLEQLAGIKSLRTLKVEDNNFDAAFVLRLVAKNPHIKTLKISTPQFQSEEKEKIRAYLHDWQDPGRPWTKEEIAQIEKLVSLHFTRRRFVRIPSGSFETIEKLSRIGLEDLFK
jgi:serine/threonine protein kinase